MKNNTKIFFLICILMAGCKSDDYYLTGQAKTISDKRIEQDLSMVNPCARFDPLNDPNNKQLKQKWLMEQQGYPTEILLQEAIDNFNQRLRCHYIEFPQPPLTENELLTAILDMPNEAPDMLDLERAYLKNAFEKRVLPKGALIDFTWGFNEKNRYQVEYLKIFLRFDLHTHPRTPQVHSNNQKNHLTRTEFIVRTQYISYKKSTW